MNPVSGKTIIITGASRGIGAATATHLAQQGAQVVLAARSAEAITDLAEALAVDGARTLAVPCDVSDWTSVEGLVAQTMATFGTVDGLVNNAGVIDPIARLGDSDPAAWRHVVDINLMGVYHGMRAVLPIMQAAGRGTIVNISSGAATGALEGWSQYCATKAAVLSLTRCGHKEYAEHGINVVGLSPGTVATDMQVAIKASGVNPVSQLDPAVHIPPAWVALGIAHLFGPAGALHAGTDFSLKTAEGRQALGLPAP